MAPDPSLKQQMVQFSKEHGFGHVVVGCDYATPGDAGVFHQLVVFNCMLNTHLFALHPEIPRDTRDNYCITLRHDATIDDLRKLAEPYMQKKG